MAAVVEQHFDIEEFMAKEQAKDLLRFTTAGSVDDGKSTLIGRLLHDARGAYEDQLKSAIRGGAIDFSLLTDGLRFAPSASRASPSTSLIAISPRPSASSFWPILPATSSTRAI